MRRPLLLALTALLASGCSSNAAPLPGAGAGLCARTDDSCLEAEAARYVSDQPFRRQVLLDSLVSRDNSYATDRLEQYALPDRGWDLRAEVDPPSEPVTMEDVLDGEAGRPLVFRGGAVGVLDGASADDAESLRQLGRRAFRQFPAQESGEIEVATSSSAALAASGLLVGPDGVVVGVRKIVSRAGYPKLAITCALCHSSLGPDGQIRDGIANRALRFGELRIAMFEELAARGAGALSDDARAALAAWGPGRIDVSADGMDNPLAVPDLIGIRDVPYLHHTATLHHLGATSLATRLETLILTRSQSDNRPPLRAMFGLALYLYSLAPPPVSPPDTDETRRGADRFAALCAGCHVAGHGFSGEPVPLASIGTDERAGLSTERGTGTYRPASLVGVAIGGPYLHDGSVATLADLLDPARLEPGFSGGVLSPGPVAGHAYGLELSDEDRAALIAYLGTFSPGP